MFTGTFGPQGFEQSVQAGPQISRQEKAVPVLLEQGDVQVTQAVGEFAEKGKVLPEAGNPAFGNNGFDLAERRPGTPDSHPEIVQKLGIDVLLYARFVAPDGSEQMSKDPPRSLCAGQVGFQRDIEFGGIVSRFPAGRPHCGVEQVFCLGFGAGFAQGPVQSAQMFLIPSDGPQNERVERLFGIGHPGLFKRCDQDGLFIPVEDAHGLPAGHGVRER